MARKFPLSKVLTIATLIILATPALATAACSSYPGPVEPDTGNPTSGMGPGITVEEALGSDLAGPLLVNGWLFVADSGGVRLCSNRLESLPPGCGEPSLLVRSLDLNDVEGLREAGGARWSETQVQLLGTVKDGALRISSRSRATGAD